MTNKEKRQERFIQKSRFKNRVKNLRYFSYGFTTDRLQGMLYHGYSENRVEKFQIN